MKKMLLLALPAVCLACATSPQGADGPAPRPDAGAIDTAATDTTRDPNAPAAPAAAPLSPLDSASATVGTASVQIKYSRPAMRGRLIFGSLVPFGEIWRTGANSATSMTTTSDVEINGVRIPAGSYTLYSLPERAADGTVGAWHLVVNRQTGQWGTEYHVEQDLARIPLRVEMLSEPVERFTIALAPQGPDRATLSLAWERTRGSADVVVVR